MVWPKEAAMWDDFKHLRVEILHGKDKEKNLHKEADIYLINPEGLEWLFSHNLKKLGFNNLTIDESTNFKACNTKRFKLLKRNLHIFKRRTILTGTPSPNGLMDLFSQIYILDDGASLGSYITHYRNSYFFPAGFGGYDWKLNPGAEKQIQEKIKPLVMRLEAKDYLELPELIENNIWVELPPDARKHYDKMEEEMLIKLKKGDIVAANAAATSTKCRQIASGGVYDADRNVHQIHMAKADAVKALVDELQGSPVLIAYDFDHDVTRLMAVLGKNTPNLSTATPKKAIEIEKAWNNGEIPVLLGHPASVGHGLNLQGSGYHVVWHSLTWNFEHYDQFIKRVLRQGNKHKRVFVHHILAENTVDEAVLTALRYKDTTQKSLLAGLKDYAQKVGNNSLHGRKNQDNEVMSRELNRSNPDALQLKMESTMSNKFAKKEKAPATEKPAKGKPIEKRKGHLVVDVDTGKMAVVGSANSKAERDILKKANIVERPSTKEEKKADEKAAKEAAKKAAEKGKAKAEKKAAKPKGEKKERAPKEDDNRKITLLVKENPKREGTAAYEMFNLYKKSKTVKDFLAAGGTTSCLRHDTAKEFIKVA